MDIKITIKIFEMIRGIMKKSLDLLAFKFGKDSDDYKYFKKQIMDYFYIALTGFFDKLKDEKIIDKCQCNANLKNGYSQCKDCGGSGYKMIKN